MKLTPWSFKNVRMNMLEDDSGELYCTTAELCSALGVDENTLREARRTHPDDFSDNCASDAGAIDFMRDNKQALNMKYVRGDMRLWNEDDMISFALLSRSNVSKEFRRELRQFIKKNAQRGWVTADAHNVVLQRLERLEKLFELAMPAFNDQASAAGTVLANHRVLKGLGDN